MKQLEQKSASQNILRGRVVTSPRYYKNNYGNLLCSFDMEVYTIIEDKNRRLRKISIVPVSLKESKARIFFNKL